MARDKGKAIAEGKEIIPTKTRALHFHTTGGRSLQPEIEVEKMEPDNEEHNKSTNPSRVYEFRGKDNPNAKTSGSSVPGAKSIKT